MVTIKLQNGKVLLKGGLASCECCGCEPNYTTYCVFIDPVSAGAGSQTVDGSLNDGYFSDGTPIVELYWEESQGEWVITDGIDFSDVGSGSTDRCDPTGSSYTNSNWNSASVTLGACP